LAREGVPIVVMNAVFDFTLLDREMLRHWPEMRPLVEPNDAGIITHPIVFDPMVFDRAIDKYRPGSRKLVDLAAVYGVPVETNAHDAEADCRMAGRVAIKLLGHSRLADMTLSEVHAKLIPTHRSNALGLAQFWEKGLSKLPMTERAERIQAIKEVRENAGLWPMRPRPGKGVTP
jgi:DNA polymerase-3 subunit epsilon